MPTQLELLQMEMDAPLSQPRKKRKEPVPRGHAAQPGTGPKGETCGTCGRLVLKRMAKTYYKCGLMNRAWTGGGATDVRTRDAACRNWTKATWTKKSDRPLC